MSPLRQKMTDLLVIKNYSIHTQECYIRSVEQRSQFFNRSLYQASSTSFSTL